MSPYNASGVYSPVSGAETAAPGQTLQSAVWNNINTDYQTALTAVGQGTVTSAMIPFPGAVSHYQLVAKAINFAASASDIATFAITLPSGVSNYMVDGLRIVNAAGNLNSATVSLYTAANAGGTAVITSTATTVSSSLPGNSNSAMVITPASTNTVMWNATSLFLHITTSVATSSTADVMLEIRAVY